MKYLLIISCLLFTSISWSKDINGDDLVVKDSMYYEKFTEKPFTGKVTGIKQGKIQKGKIEGKWIEYWESGILKESYTIKKGNYDGEFLTYHENGNLKTKGNFIKGKKQGEWLQYLQNGDLRAKGTYKNDKEIEGNFLFFYPAIMWKSVDEVSLNEIYKNGEEIETLYGILSFEMNYKNGKLDGDYISYDENGKISAYGLHKNGIRVGEWWRDLGILSVYDYYNESGQWIEERIYSPSEDSSYGKRKYFDYYENGQLKEKTNYKDGKQEGEHLYYYENGQLESKWNYNDGKKEGEYLYYDDDGQLAIKGHFKDGQEEGEWLFYLENGLLEYTDIYINGELIDTITP